MRDGWPVIPLGDLVERVTKKNSQGIDRVFSVSAEHGLIDQEEFFNKRVASRDLTKYTVVDPGSYVYSKSYSRGAPVGAVVRNKLDVPGVVSPIYIVFRVTSEALVDGFLDLAVKSTVYAQALGSMMKEGGRAHGGINISLKDYFSTPVPLPPIQEQRRIVDLVASVDDAIGSSAAWVEAVQVALNALLRESFEPWPESSLRLGDLVDMSSGPSWKASQEARSQVEGSIPVLKIGNTPPSGQIDLSDVTFVSGLPESTKTLRENDLILIRTNGNRDRIGNVYRATREVVGFGYSAFQIALRPRSGVNSAYLYWALRAPWVQDAISDAASGTTGLGNIAIRWLRELPIWMPDSKEAERLVAMFESIESAASKAQRRLTFLRVLRGKVLQELLSGKHEIPESYDHLLEDAS